MKYNKWAIDNNELNPAINLAKVESINMGVQRPDIQFKFVNNPPVTWNFSDFERATLVYNELLTRLSNPRTAAVKN